MDTLGALALATEAPTDHLMDRPPVGRRYDIYYRGHFFTKRINLELLGLKDI
jgi:hypothetical protein